MGDPPRVGDPVRLPSGSRRTPFAVAPPPPPSCVPSSPPPWGAVDSLGASLSSLNPGGVAVADAAALRLPGPRNAERLLAVRDVAMSRWCR